MTIAEQIYELVKSLPQDQASEILTFAESIRAKYLNAHQLSNTVTPQQWKELVYSLAGSWGQDYEGRTESLPYKKL
ncbi:DUF2281 domain-containing protein [Nostoc sp. LEGE 06077]|uniref:DUF2281 domain-containing protein n=1 Tax=Nostoc sp. LEGE 06077 TaxID=915325 RepID=UPI001881E432|nr:DUF2281 domain-containing protein [Nostoc sp. LEGE 06077]MBE9204976.1 DUF2281 domain-containing protein [Nostoc sp. LEGE 06077]